MTRRRTWPLTSMRDCAGLLACSALAHADRDKLLLIGGVSTIDGAAGGGLTPWAVTGSCATDGEVRGTAFFTGAKTRDCSLATYGAAIGIRAVMEDCFVRLQADARTGPFFKNANRERLVNQLTEQLCQESDGPCTCQGAPMDPVHASMNIGKGDFDAPVAALQQSMDAKGIPFPARNSMLARLAPMHREIVTQER